MGQIEASVKALWLLGLWAFERKRLGQKRSHFWSHKCAKKVPSSKKGKTKKRKEAKEKKKKVKEV